MTVVSITSATELTSTQLSKIKKAVERRYGSDVTYASPQIDRSLLGGFTIAVGSELYDFSYSTQFNQLKTDLLSKVS